MGASGENEQGNWFIKFLLVLAGIGFPAAFKFGWDATQNSLQALGLMVLYGVVVALLGIVTGLWKRLEVNWLDRAAKWIDARVMSTVSGYQQKYYKHLIAKWRTFDLKGLSTQGPYSLELEQVFVHLSIAADNKFSSNPLEVPQELAQGSHSIWEYVNSTKMQNIAVIGAPGSGKTTLLKYMTLTLTGKPDQQRRAGVPRLLPILLFLRDHAEVIQQDPDVDLADVIQEHLAKQLKLDAPSGWFKAWLNSGKCLVMLDGLDEVADPKIRKVVVNWVEQQVGAYGQNRFVVSSRPFGYKSNPLNSFNVLNVRPFTSEQIQQFVNNWYTANEVMSHQRNDLSVKMAAEEGAADLLRRIRNTPSLSALAINPLLLTMIANVHRYRSSLPGRRVELYAEICEVFLGKRQQARGVEQDLTPAQKQRVLQPLAYTMMRKNVREIGQSEAVAVIQETLEAVNPQTKGAEFLKMVEDSSGLLLERENRIYSFAHLTFQEFLAAVHIQDQKLEDELVKHVSESWWHETSRLYSARANATRIVAACLANNPPPIMALVLAIECTDEARELQPDVRSRLDAMLQSGVEPNNPEDRRVVAEALLALRLRRLTRLNDELYVDDTPITHAEYQLFIDDKRLQNKFVQPDHWTTYNFPAGKGRKPIVGITPLNAIAFCEWLTEREANEWIYRIPHASERHTYENFKIGYWTRVGEYQFHLAGSEYASNAHLSQARLEQCVMDDCVLLGIITGTFELAHDLDIDLTSTLDRDLDIDLALALARTHDLADILDPTSTLDRASTSTLGRATTRTNTSTLALATALATVTNNDLAVALDLATTLDRASTSTSTLDRIVARKYILLITNYLHHARPELKRFRSNNEKREQFDKLIDSYFNFYVDLVVLQERIEGKLEAFEGLRIVRERKPEKT